MCLIILPLSFLSYFHSSWSAVYTLAKVFGVEGELSGIARQGSGSACRSMYGGFVQWIMGQRDDGKDSLAQQVEPESHWPELRILVLVVGPFFFFFNETKIIFYCVLLTSCRLLFVLAYMCLLDVLKQPSTLSPL